VTGYNTNKWNTINMSVFLTLGGFWNLVPISPSWFYYRSMALRLTLCACVFLLTVTSQYSCTVTLCLMFFLDLSVFGLANPCTCWGKDRITRLCASHTLVVWCANSLFFFPSQAHTFVSFSFLGLYIKQHQSIKLFERGVEVAFYK